MKKFGFEDKKYHLRLFEALEEDEHEHHDGDTIQSVMEEIQNLLDASYFLGINPLRGLRKILPQYSWRFYRIRNEERYERHVKEVVSKSDFIWGIWYDHDEHQLVTATKLDRPQHLMFFWAGANDKKFLHEQIESFGAITVYWEN